MSDVVRDLDRLLRGKFSEQGADPASIPLAHLVKAALVLGVTYGVFMGLYAATRAEQPTFLQLAVSAAKVPLLFLLTLVVTFPSLYVFSALGNSPLRGADTARLLLAAVTVNLALLASFGPITGFFTLSTDSYAFMIVLNVAFFGLSGFVGLGFLRRSLSTLFARAGDDEMRAAEREALAALSAGEPVTAGAARDADADDEEEDAARAARAARRAATESVRAQISARLAASQRVFRVWIVIYAIVGAQMAWILRPFVGAPSLPFQLFRPRSSNFFEGFWHSVQALFR